jgi:hypothetical protein
MLDAPSEDTVAGLRDRAILSVGLQVGLRTPRSRPSLSGNERTKPALIRRTSAMKS